MSLAPNRKVKAGATAGGLSGLVAVLLTHYVFKHVPTDVQVYVPVVTAWVLHFVVAYLTPLEKYIPKP